MTADERDTLDALLDDPRAFRAWLAALPDDMAYDVDDAGECYVSRYLTERLGRPVMSFVDRWYSVDRGWSAKHPDWSSWFQWELCNYIDGRSITTVRKETALAFLDGWLSIASHQ